MRWQGRVHTQRNVEKTDKDGGDILLQEVSEKLDIFSSVSSRYKAANKTAWNAITHAVNALSGKGRRTDEVKNKWFDLKSEAYTKKYAIVWQSQSAEICTLWVYKQHDQSLIIGWQGSPVNIIDFN